ncbi:uncharacterized protein M421DRAFT_289459 [Didymella exigua CBS 183.55]|uniref:Uncharacterized protein n=1 Tax=Didymella exigua CBS 183.55 TaxID=1150837 RepID=A0A6A5RWV6_9PLEO|nr:uncharacterized protein M421DRAFT_289459 [Didymella exigua CBS 183.55]KAF1932332.1 hypothetical protein M421DRAFT_289459 [Didymella exigua CBS 183.55]
MHHATKFPPKKPATSRMRREAARDNSERNLKHSSLLRLSGEIRNRTYKHVFSGNLLRILPNEVCVHSAPLYQCAKLSPENWTQQLHFTRVCFDVYTEPKLLPWVYSHVWFFSRPDQGGHRNSWIETVGRSICHAVWNVEMCAQPSIDAEYSSLRLREDLVDIHKSFPSVKKIRIRVEAKESRLPFTQE